MMKTVGKILKILLILVIIAGAGYGGYRYVQYRNNSEKGEDINYSRIKASSGSLSQQVISTGSLSISQTEVIKAPVDIKIDELLVSAGDAVEAGTPLLSVNVKLLEDAIKTMQTDITSLDSEILSLAAAQSDTGVITAGTSGRLKAIYAKKGEMIDDVMKRDGALMLFSMDGLMKITIPAQAGAAIGDSYVIQYGTSKYTGYVNRVIGDTMILTFSDSRVLPGEEVQVLSGNAILATVKAEVNLPYKLISFLDGRISAIPGTLNGSMSRTTKLIEFSDLSFTDEYFEKVQEREDQWAELEQVKALAADPYLYAAQAGIVSEISAIEKETTEKDQTLLSLYVGDNFEMEISVDELDIIKVQKGQEATLVMDALSDQSYAASVSRISQLGQSSGGITSYQVTLEVKGDEKLKLGMNGTATIMTGEQSGALLIPLSALQSDKQGSYVWLYSENYTATKEAPGLKNYVTTGLSDADYVAVLSGLSLGDEVLVVRTASSAAGETNNRFNRTDGGMTMPMNIDGGNRNSPGSGGNGGGNFPGGGSGRPGGN